MIQGHGGNVYDLAKALGCRPCEIVDMSSNLNPMGSPPGLETHLKKVIHTITRLPEADARSATASVARKYGLQPECILAGNGTTQFIYAIPRILKTRRALILGPTYADYADACALHKVDVAYLMSSPSNAFRPDLARLTTQAHRHDIVFICNPNNPTGALIPVRDLDRLCRLHTGTFFVVDESYLPFTREGQAASMAPSGLPNVLVLNSMSKIFKIPGLRIGFLISAKETLQHFEPFQLPWAVNSLAQAAVDFLMDPAFLMDTFVEETGVFLETQRKNFLNRLSNTRLKLFPSATSFVLGQLPSHLTADMICNHLARKRILIRNCTNFNGLSDRYIRISLKSEKINALLADTLLELLTGLEQND